MRNLPIMLVAMALAASLSLAACGRKSEPQEAAQKEKPDVIVPLNVRDPSALVMGPATQRPSFYEADADMRPGARPAQAPQRRDWARLLVRRGPRAPMAEGCRAVSLPVREYELLDIRPGDRVDVLTVFDAVASGRRKEKLAATLLQNVKVLGTAVSGDLNGQGVIKLMLNPSEAQYATLALYQGELSVIRRQAGDVEIYPMEMSSYHKLFR